MACGLQSPNLENIQRPQVVFGFLVGEFYHNFYDKMSNGSCPGKLSYEHSRKMITLYYYSPSLLLFVTPFSCLMTLSSQKL